MLRILRISNFQYPINMPLTIGRKNIGPLLIALCVVLFLIKLVPQLRSYNYSAAQNVQTNPHLFDFKAQNLKFSRANIFENTQIPQDDPRILEYLLNGHLTPPPTSDKGYNLTCGGNTFCFASGADKGETAKKEYYEAVGILRNSINQLLGDKRNGFFIECGANDGEFLSNSLYFEKELNWTGLLIEADPLPYADLKKKNRKAFISNTCLSTEPKPTKLKLERGEYQGLSKLGGGSRSKSKSKNVEFEVECFPLYSYLAALEVQVVDYMSLDIEGFELKVLRNFPFDKVLVKIISIEANGNTFAALNKLLESKNFSLYKSIKAPYINDHLFVNNAFLQKN